MGHLDGRVAIVTGASRGIGRAIALELAQHGAQVAVNYRSGEAQAQEVVGEIETAGGTAMTAQANVSDINAWAGGACGRGVGQGRYSGQQRWYHPRPIVTQADRRRLAGCDQHQSEQRVFLHDGGDADHDRAELWPDH